MKILVVKYWDNLRSSFWFVPGLMVLVAAMLSFVTVAIDEELQTDWLSKWGFVYTGGAEGAGAVLGTLASSMMTITGLVFSMTLVALTLASSQFGPRLLRNFMRDSTNQSVLGIFVATFLYCLLVLRTIRRDDNGFVPHISVTIGVVLALVSLGLLIYFIHHVAVSIQADKIVAKVGDELTQGINKLFPHEIGDSNPNASLKPGEAIPESFDQDAKAIEAKDDGYLQLIDSELLLNTAKKQDLLLRIERRPGHYVFQGSPLISARPRERVSESVVQDLQRAFVLGMQRTPTQDVEFAVLQLVEVGVRALSPGVNDPFTAITCVDRLSSAMCRLANREFPSPYRRDSNQQLRVIAPVVTFPAILDAAFNQIRQNARTNAAVTIRLMEVFASIATCVRTEEDRQAVRKHAEMVERGSREGLPEENDRLAVRERFEIVQTILSPHITVGQTPVPL